MELTREITLPATADEVWRSLTEPAWLGEDASIELHPDGEVRAGDRTGFVEEVEEERRLVFWWAAPEEDSTRVELELEEYEDMTHVRVVESRPLANIRRRRPAPLTRPPPPARAPRARPPMKRRVRSAPGWVARRRRSRADPCRARRPDGLTGSACPGWRPGSLPGARARFRGRPFRSPAHRVRRRWCRSQPHRPRGQHDGSALRAAEPRTGVVGVDLGRIRGGSTPRRRCPPPGRRPQARSPSTKSGHHPSTNRRARWTAGR
jgi:hypothetical protein